MNLNHNKIYIHQMEFKISYNYPFKKVSVFDLIYLPSIFLKNPIKIKIAKI